MKSTKLTRTLFAGMMTCSMALTAIAVPVFTGPTVTQAATSEEADVQQFKLNLHKYQVLDGREFDNADVANIDVTDLKPLADISFDVFNVTELYYSLRKTHPTWSAKQIGREITQNWLANEDEKEEAGEDRTTPDVTIKTGANGIATTDLPATTEIDDNQLNSVFVFVEHPSANQQYMQSAPFILGMSHELAEKGTVNLFAKNYMAEKDLMGADNKLLEDGYYSYEVGDVLKYESSTPVSAGIMREEEGYKRISFSDEMTAIGTDLTDLKVGYYIGDTWTPVSDRFFKLGNPQSSMGDGAEEWFKTHEFAGFSFDFDLEKVSDENKADMKALMEEIAGKQLIFKYEMTINDQAKPYEEIGNLFIGKFTNNHGDFTFKDDAPEAEVGAHKFKKIDSESGRGLVDAEFIITRKTKDGNTEYAVLNDTNGNSDDGHYVPETIDWVPEARKDEASTIKSGTGGMIYVSGLKAGKYTLTETKAPTGYTITQPDWEFNIKEAVEGPGADEDGTIIESVTITNTPDDDILPITGGVGIVTFLAIGAMAMGGALYYKKKKA